MAAAEAAAAPALAPAMAATLPVNTPRLRRLPPEYKETRLVTHAISASFNSRLLLQRLYYIQRRLKRN